MSEQKTINTLIGITNKWLDVIGDAGLRMIYKNANTGSQSPLPFVRFSFTDMRILVVSDSVKHQDYLCLQGVVVLNDIESDFTRYLITRISEMSVNPLTLYIPESYRAAISEQHTIIHGDALQRNDIVWNPSPEDLETDFFTDCSARGNGRDTCVASYGVVCTRGILIGREWAEKVEPAEIIYGDSRVTAKPTNIRAEGLALVRALELARRIPASVKIHTDSKFWIQMLQEYIPKWVEREQSFKDKKNSDIVDCIWKLYKDQRNVELVFVRAWHDRKQPTETTDLYYWMGNRKAEQAAERKLNIASR